jgi:predicted DNA-binding WGR domain protein
VVNFFMPRWSTSSCRSPIRQNGPETVVRFGRIGTTGQTSTKAFPDEAAAAKFAEKMIQEKLAKGYQEVG